MRILVAVSATELVYTVEVWLGSEEGTRLASHTMRRLPSAPWVAPFGSNIPLPGKPHSHLVGDDVAREQLANRLAKGPLQGGDVELIGRYLFDSLLGPKAWEGILEQASILNEKSVELALAWPAEERDLHHPCWEAMHDGSGFIAAHPGLPVAVTRIVTDARKGDRRDEKPPDRVSAPARVLFAIGADLKDGDIRAGAEVIGLLRDAERGGGAIDSLILESASPGRLARECARFKPDIVHFVSHGRLLRKGGGQLQMQKDEEDDDGWVGADELLRALETENGMPVVVVLTGCESAATGKHMDSLAAEMVKGGIPCVIGMAGKISDPVCRLFSRGFGVALNKGEPLVEALTHGRRAGLQKQKRAAGDDQAWALPSIYLAPAVTAEYAPVNADEASAALKRFEEYGLLYEPVFCGRGKLTQLFDKLLDPESTLEVLVAYATEPEQLGKTRLLHEYAGQALRAGHVVVMIDDHGSERDRSMLPDSPLQLATAMLRAIAKTRQRFELDPPLDSVLLGELERVCKLDSELASTDPKGRWARLEGFLVDCEEVDVGGGISGSLREALASDLIDLIGAARASADTSVGSESRVVVIVGGIGRWGSATELISDSLLEANGLGSKDEHVPLFATCALSDAEERLTAAREKARPLRWAHYEKLEAFEAGEDTLAYHWVLLHPRAIGKNPDPLPAYAPNFSDSSDAEVWERKFKKYIGGIPGRFDDPIFEAVVESLEEQCVLAKADDDDVMASYNKQQL